MKNFITTLLAFGMPLLWVAAIPKPENNYKGDSLTQLRVIKTQKTIEDFYKTNKRLPANFSEIRLASMKMWDFYVPFDGFGSRLQYVVLGKKQYILRSFGKDKRENSIITEQDSVHIELDPLPPTPPQLDTSGDHRSLFPAALLPAQRSPTYQLVAQLILNPQSHTRHLVVRSLKRPDFIMIAVHPKVEEFFWLPSGNTIVYTATNDDIYRDGIYLWNLATNEHTNLLEGFQDKINVAAESSLKKFYVSLSSVSPSGEGFYAFIAGKGGPSLDPAIFYSSDNFYWINVGKEPEKGVGITRVQLNDDNWLTSNANPLAHIKQPFRGTDSQNKWGTLPNAGKIEEVIEKWQHFSANHTDSPLFHYSLFWLGSIYGDGYKLLAPVNGNEARTLSAFGAEITRALATSPDAPSYLRGFGQNIYNRLSQGQSLEYQLSKLSL
jgi:hypothetical protein